MMNPEQLKAAGNEAFKRRDYKESVRLYTESLQGLQTAAALLADGTQEQPNAVASNEHLKVTLLCNRSLAHHRLGSYAAAADDAQAALHLQATHSKAAFRLAAALLQLGDVTAAMHALHLPPESQGSTREQLPAGWDVLKAHAASRLAHERRQAASVVGVAGSAWAQLQGVLALLEAEADGEAIGTEADPAALMQQLAALLKPPASSDASSVEVAACLAALLEAAGCRAYQLLLFHLASPTASCVEAAASALKAAALAAAASSSTLWPAVVWQRLVALATDCSGGTHSGMAAALQLLEWAAGRDSYVRLQLLLHPLPAPEGAESTVSPVDQVLSALADSSRLHHMPPAAVSAAAQLIRRYAADPASTDALAVCRPLLPLLRAAAAAERMAAFQLEADGADQAASAAVEASQADGGSGLVRSSAGLAVSPADQEAQAAAPRTLAEAEEQALLALRQKRQRVFIAELVSLRHELLGAALELAARSRELLLREAVEERGSGVREEKRSVGAGAYLTELLAWVRQLHEQQPRRTSPVLGADGSAQTYEKRRFAADFKDNPLGDFLVSMDLADTGGMPATAANQEAQQSGQQPPLLELALELLLLTSAASATMAALLHRRKLFGLCEELCRYCTPSVVTAALRLYATTADATQAAADELYGGQAVAPLAALFQFSMREPRRQRAAVRLAAVADSCCGDDFALLTAGGDSAVCCAWQLLQGAEQGEQGNALQAVSQAMLNSARTLLLRCCDRAQRQQQLAPSMPPRGGAWAAIGSRAMKQALKERHLKPAQPAPKLVADSATFDHLKKGFLASSSTGPAAAAQGSSAAKPVMTAPGGGGNAHSRAVESGSGNSHSYKSGAVVIEELPADDPPYVPAADDEPAAIPTPQQHLRAAAPVGSAEASEGEQHSYQGEEEGEEESLPDLQDRFDSGQGLAAGQRLARADWMALPLAKKVRWKEEGQEVSLFVAVPAGTKAADVQVSVAHSQLTVGLKWFGRVVGGPLHGRVKEEEVHWCLEDGEVFVLLVKADAGKRWKALFDGRLEESYRTGLLREGFDLGDRTPRYDLLSDSARALIAAVEERQMYLKAGLVDATTTEDFALIQG